MNKEIKEILIVEDEFYIYILLKELLLDFNSEYIIYHAVNGRKAVEFCEKNQNLHLIFMDINMPVMNGLEATSIIKKKLPKIPIIVQSACSYPKEEQAAFDAGCDDFIAKPINTEILYEKLAKNETR